MQIIVKSRHTVLPKKIKALAAEKFGHIEKLLDRVQTIEIAIGEEHNPRISNKHHVEVTLVTKSRRMHAAASGPDVMSAIDRVIDKVEAQIRHFKGKAISKTHRSSSMGRVAASVADRVLPTFTVASDVVKAPKPASGADKKTVAKKPAMKKKTVAKKPAMTKKTVAKKPAAKKPVVKKAVAKKPVAKKTTVKRSPAKATKRVAAATKPRRRATS